MPSEDLPLLYSCAGSQGLLEPILTVLGKQQCFILNSLQAHQRHQVTEL